MSKIVITDPKARALYRELEQKLGLAEPVGLLTLISRSQAAYAAYKVAIETGESPRTVAVLKVISDNLDEQVRARVKELQRNNRKPWRKSWQRRILQLWKED